MRVRMIAEREEKRPDVGGELIAHALHDGLPLVCTIQAPIKLGARGAGLLSVASLNAIVQAK